ncbi:MAG: Gfo/Idh/MocA family oxidoreductase [Deltaproteobacteria bacterium]|nr:Gfo/Idh/MocA family oxidoreductase [Deltaproteobacteria bacterium]
MTTKLRVGILGAGWAGKGHIQAYTQQDNVEVTALWSRTRLRAETLANELNLPNLQIYDHWQDLIEQANVDIISLATPPMLRLEPFEMALERDCHILVEKPFSVGLAVANAMVNQAQGSHSITATSFNWRYAPGYQYAWREVQNGRIGKIRDVKTEWRFRILSSDLFAPKLWIARPDDNDGLLGGWTSHDFDKARFLTGTEFENIVSKLTPYEIVQDEGFRVEMGSQMHMAEMSDGVLGNFRVGITAGQNEWSLLLNGAEGTLSVTNDAVTYQSASDSEPKKIDILEQDQIPIGLDPMQHTWNLLVADFISAIQAGDVIHSTVPHLPTLTDGMLIQKVIAAARRSEDEERWVSLSELK